MKVHSPTGLRLPAALAARLGGCELDETTRGETEARVFRVRRGSGVRYFLKCGAAGVGIEDEAVRLRWLSGRVRVPSVESFVVEGGFAYLLTTALPGRSAADPGARRPECVVIGLARELRAWHASSFADCPFDQSVEAQLERARHRVREGLVDEGRFDAGRRGLTAEQVLEEAVRKRPRSEGRVLTHGDPCLANAVFAGKACVGMVDVGRSGVADPYQDLAVSARSIAGRLGERWALAFLEHYGVSHVDRDRLAYYQLLDELF